MREFVKTTLIGGAVFLIPLVLVLFLLGYAISLARDALQPLLPLFEHVQFGPFGGVGMLTLMAVLLLLILSFAAGVFARTRSGLRVTGYVENSALGRLPQYRMVRTMMGTLSSSQPSAETRAALLAVEAGWQLCYVVETLENGWLVVFVPEAPNPMTGSVMYYPPDRVVQLKMSVVQAAGILQSLGIGSAALLSGADAAVLASRAS